MIEFGPHNAAARAFRKSLGDLTPEQNLMAAVVLQAIMDLGDIEQKANARHFLQSKRVQPYLDVLEVDHDGLARFVEVADKAKPQWKQTVLKAAA